MRIFVRSSKFIFPYNVSLLEILHLVYRISIFGLQETLLIISTKEYKEILEVCMPIVNRMAELHDEITGWPREFHSNPELLYDVHQTAKSVAEKLQSFGCDEVVCGIGKTGLVGIIRGKNGDNGKVIGLRADMDALPIHELTRKPWASKTPGKMHACGHDGHTSMLLGAAKYLAETRNFEGSVAVIFQPAEEGGAGGKAMVDDGMMERFGITEVYGMHNLPGLEVGKFSIRSGAIMAATDSFDIKVIGQGGHAAMPHLGVDPIVIAAQIITGIQQIVSRSSNPLESLIISVTKVDGGSAYNVIPNEVVLKGTIRSLNSEVREFAKVQLEKIASGIAKANSAKTEIRIVSGYPVTYNHEAQTQIAGNVAGLVGGIGGVDMDVMPMMGGEDFSYMLEAKPGAFIFTGNGDSSGLHHPEYDFNDLAIPHGCSYWIKLVETEMNTSA